MGCLLFQRFRREDLGLQRAQSMLRVLMVCAGAALAAALSGCLIARSVIGADLLQAYTGFVYEGPWWPRTMNSRISSRVARGDVR